jgi:hypothetical protein
MTDLYERLEELQDVTHVLTRDVEQLRPLLGARYFAAAVSDQEEANRRFYVRAIFALIEAVVEQHKRLLLDLAGRGTITLAAGVREALSERLYAVGDRGNVVEREQYIQLQRQIRAVCRPAADAFGHGLHVSFGAQGWASVQGAVKVRDRRTHPKGFEDGHVDEDALDMVDRGHTWFRDFHNEFVRVARAHREQHRW